MRSCEMGPSLRQVKICVRTFLGAASGAGSVLRKASGVLPSRNDAWRAALLWCSSLIIGYGRALTSTGRFFIPGGGHLELRHCRVHCRRCPVPWCSAASPSLKHWRIYLQASSLHSIMLCSSSASHQRCSSSIYWPSYLCCSSAWTQAFDVYEDVLCLLHGLNGISLSDYPIKNATS